MRDHTKNILIALLFALVVGAVLFGAGYVIGVGMVIDKGAGIIIQYLDYKNITIQGISKADILKFASMIKLR